MKGVKDLFDLCWFDSLIDRENKHVAQDLSTLGARKSSLDMMRRNTEGLSQVSSVMAVQPDYSRSPSPAPSIAA